MDSSTIVDEAEILCEMKVKAHLVSMLRET